MEHLQKSAKFFGEHKDRQFEAKVSKPFLDPLTSLLPNYHFTSAPIKDQRADLGQMAEDAKRLLALQLSYERELEHKFLFAGQSVNDFIFTLLAEGFGKRAEKVRADWRVPDKRSVRAH